MSEENKKLEVVTGNGENLDISPVYDHIPSVKPKLNKEHQSVIIPEEKKKAFKKKKIKGLKKQEFKGKKKEN